jgi:DNA-binding CsgD family transcriptional regulator
MTIDRITPAQARVLDAVIEAGSYGPAADAIGLTLRTVETHISNAKRRCDIDSTLHLLLARDRQKRGGAAVTVTRDDFLGWAAPSEERPAEQETIA